MTHRVKTPSLRCAHCFSISCLILLLAGCASGQKHAGETFGQIDQALKQAVNSSASSPSQTSKDTLSQAMLPPLQLGTPTPPANAEARFDLAVSNAPANQVFMALVTGTPYSMLLAPDVAGKITVNLKNVTVREVLETLRELYGYEFRMQGTRIYIQSNTLQTRAFQVNYLAGRRQGQSDLRVTSSSISVTNGASNSGTSSNGSAAPNLGNGSGNNGGSNMNASGAQSSRIYTTSDSDFWRELGQALESIVGTEDGRSTIISPGSGVILVKAFPTELRAVENYLKLTQLIVERQVMLEAKIIEVSLNEDYQSGVNWAAFGGGANGRQRFGLGVVSPGSSIGVTGSLATPGVAITPGSAAGSIITSSSKNIVGLAFQTANFASLLTFLETQGNVQVLSSPRIATINNQKAVLKVGNDEFFVTNVSTTVSSNGTSNVTTPSVTLQPFFSGIALDVTPQIDDANNIILHIHPSISVVTEKQKTVDLGSVGQLSLPLATSTINETDSIVRVQDGNIVAIGGLMKHEQSADRTGLPGTTNSSLGSLFGQRSNSLRKSELVILIKPTIIESASDWKSDLVDTQDRLEQFDPRRGSTP
ncbi:MAG: secretin N-terminal domain-containing protein [Pseudomonadota bacterium]